MGAIATSRPPDVSGGLEIVKWHTGNFAIRIAGDENPFCLEFIFPRKRNATAFRALLLAVRADWSGIPRDENGKRSIPDGQLRAVARLVRLANDERRRRLYQLCLLCGGRPQACACSRPVRDGDPRRWAAEDMEWSR